MSILVGVESYLIEPGMGLIQNLPPQSASSSSRSKRFQKHTRTDDDGPLQIVIFEHTDVGGTGGLVLNRPTPLLLGPPHIDIPRFQPFKGLPLMLGCGYDEDQHDDDDDNDDGDDDQPGGRRRGRGGQERFGLGEVSPWFWLHNIENVPGSYKLEGASGPLFFGGHLEEAAKQITKPLEKYHQTDHGSNTSGSSNGSIGPQIPPDEDDHPGTTTAAGRIKFFRQYRIWSPGELQRELDEGKWIPCRQDPQQALQVVMPKIILPTFK